MRQRFIPRASVLAGGLLAVVTLSHLAGASTDEVTEQRTLDRTFDIPAGSQVVIDNVHGSIAVRGHDRNVVEMVARETIHARSPEKAVLARQEVTLQVLEQQGEVELELYVDGPFREHHHRSWRDPGYRVVFDFELRVPARTDLALRTVNEGDIRVDGVQGELLVHNVNGAIRLDRIAGSTEAETVNGAVEGSFLAVPERAARFVTLNGTIDISFPADLSADLQLATQHGEMWSGFEVSALPVPQPVRHTKDGRTVIETAAGAHVRVGSGGPALIFKTFNGDIYVRKGN